MFNYIFYNDYADKSMSRYLIKGLMIAMEMIMQYKRHQYLLIIEDSICACIQNNAFHFDDFDYCFKNSVFTPCCHEPIYKQYETIL